MELAFAGLHQLCAPMLSRAECLPVPQREALRTAFGLADGPPPDRFLVGLAVLSLLSEVAAERPLVCVIDDEQWLDHASAQALGIVARRLAADPVGLVFAARVPGEELTGLRELTVAGCRMRTRGCCCPRRWPGRVMLVRQVRLARDAGALDQLPIMLGALGTAAAWSGDFAAAVSLITEADAVCEATGSRGAPFAAMMLASLRGDQAEAAPRIEATIAQATTGGQGIAVAYAHWVAAILANGLARYDEALAAARHACEDTFTLYISMWALPELVEAAARTGNTHRRLARWSGWRGRPRRAGPTSGWASRRAAGRC